MPTLAELIQQLQDKSEPFFTRALAVGFEDSTTFVFASDSDPLSNLEKAIRLGGTPVGFLDIVRQDGKKSSVTVRSLISDPWAREYLTKLAHNFATSFQSPRLDAN